MKNQYFAIVFLGLAFLTACSSAKIISDIDQQADFTQYQTYTWSAEEDPYNKNFPQFDNSLNRERWHKAIDVAMKNQGYVLVEGAADIEVDFHLEFEHNVVPYHNNQVEVEDTYTSFRPTSGFHYDRGTVIIHFVDLSGEQIIWQGISTKVIDMGQLEDAEANIQKAANKIFEKLSKTLAKQLQ